ncbi:Rhomboid family protein [Indibacter alkaliphilus LW1]|jgi:membrane associated rhomboid family serine protease|uniref:Rhomboid family protein n=1 Tax=Indibacter alkaliphilus (strain CCUG 57479 / KCTC 22604 / LW1) TaxID=1189612 RepID=S2DXG3_INDAL|nr:rhomboid family intramembrane serine protease [Indibacter alkaliphilus]EOZ96801.1 Rhomboid family protein [Indibacter alkaliphilus LW1]
MELSATVILIAITVLTSYYAWKNPTIMERWMFTPYAIKNRGQWDRFILSGFIHKDSMHLLFNMFTFFFFGRVIEMFLTYRLGFGLGIVTYIFFYISAIVIADIPTYLKHHNNSYYRALGASGGVAATVFASIILMPLSDICLFGIVCLPGFALGIMFLLYSVFKAKKGDDGINHDAHLYGALFGIAFILILSPQSAFDFIDQIKSFRLF